MHCLNWDELNLDLQGTYKLDKIHNVVQVVAVPCATTFTDAYGVKHTAGPDCVWDKDEVLQNVGSVFNSIVYTNSGIF